MDPSRHRISRDEKVIFSKRPHWFTLIQSIFMLSVAIAVLVGTIFVSVAIPSLNGLPILVGVLLLLITIVGSIGKYLRWSTTRFTLTTHRLAVSEGVLSRTSKEIPLDRIMNLSHHQSFVERIFHTGDLSVESAGETGLQVFNDVDEPFRMQQLIYKAIEDFRESRESQSMRPQDGLGSKRYDGYEHEETIDIPAEIVKLAKLRDEGLLTNEEFSTKKRELLSRY